MRTARQVVVRGEDEVNALAVRHLRRPVTQTLGVAPLAGGHPGCALAPLELLAQRGTVCPGLCWTALANHVRYTRVVRVWRDAPDIVCSSDLASGHFLMVITLCTHRT